jgi:hypothetical protein
MIMVSQKTESYIKMLMASKKLADVDEKAQSLYGRIDAIERMAEYLQDLCPSVLGLNVTTEQCVKFEQSCGMNFLEIANAVMARYDDMYADK